MDDKILVIKQKINNMCLPFVFISSTQEKIPSGDPPERTQAVLTALEQLPYTTVKTQDANKDEFYSVLESVHSKEYLAFLEKASNELPEGKVILDHPFLPEGIPKTLPVVKGIFEQTIDSAMTAFYAGKEIVNGHKKIYSVSRPPGHHAGRAYMGAYCYLNIDGIAVEAILRGGIKPVALLDLDFHFGNGSEDLLRDNPDVFFASIHADTEKYYPLFKTEEKNNRQLLINFKNPPSEDEYLNAIDKAIEKIMNFGCKALVVTMGFDTVAEDPFSGWSLTPPIFKQVGMRIKNMGIPVCILQAGGYRFEIMGESARNLCEGLK